MDNGDDIAIFRLEDLRQIALTAKVVAIPLAASLLAVLLIIMGQRDSIEVSKAIAIKLAAINCEVVQDVYKRQS